MNDAKVTHVDWYRPLTVADLMVIEAMPDELRTVVERYVRRSAVIPSAAAQDETEYERGWQDAMDRAEEEVSSIHFPHAPRRMSRSVA